MWTGERGVVLKAEGRTACRESNGARRVAREEAGRCRECARWKKFRP